MKNVCSLRVAAGFALSILATVSGTHPLWAQETPVQTGLVLPESAYPAFKITAPQMTEGMDKRLAAPMYEGGVEITPFSRKGVSRAILTIEQGAGILIFKDATTKGSAKVIGYMPFDAAGQTVTIRNGVTTYRDGHARTLRVLPPTAPEFQWHYNNEAIEKARIHFLNAQ